MDQVLINESDAFKEIVINVSLKREIGFHIRFYIGLKILGIVAYLLRPCKFNIETFGCDCEDACVCCGEKIGDVK